MRPSDLLRLRYDRAGNQDHRRQQHRANDRPVLGIEVEMDKGSTEGEGPGRERDNGDDDLPSGRRGALLAGGDGCVDGRGDQEGSKDQPLLVGGHVEGAAVNEALDDDIDRNNLRGDILDKPSKVTISLWLGIRWRGCGCRTGGDRSLRANSCDDATCHT